MMASRRNAASGPETQVTDPNDDSAAFEMQNWLSYQTSWIAGEQRVRRR